MKGLLLKEWYMVQRYRNTYLLYMLIFGGAGIFTGNTGMYSIMAVVFMTSIPLSSFSVDETCKWDKMAITTPLSRHQIVASKYLMMLGCILFSVLCAAVAVGIGAIVRPENTDFMAGITSVSAGLGVMAIMMMVLLPILFKVGAEKGRIMMMLVFGGSFMAILVGSMLLSRLAKASGYVSQAVTSSVIFGSLVVMPLVVLLGLFVSYKVSCAVYAKREF